MSLSLTFHSLAIASHIAKPEITGCESIILTQRRTADIGNNIRATARTDLEHQTQWFIVNVFRNHFKFLRQAMAP